MKNERILFKDKLNCCACGACMNICPQDAIQMVEDDYSFLYPQINFEKCVDCGLCEKVCTFQHREESSDAIIVYAAAQKDSEKIRQSASGGIFAAIAEAVLNEKGMVYGAEMIAENNNLCVEHKGINHLENLHELLGSKYVQSNINFIYKEIKEKLQDEQFVLFSGTPCQVAGLKGYLQKDHDNLLTIDLVCHGVPSLKMFQDYIAVVQNKIKRRITNFKFRDKTQGWGLAAKLVFNNQNKETEESIISSQDSSYYSLFLKSEIYRDSCYSCKYASRNRPGDITIGDYWGIEARHPEYLKINGGHLDEKLGISCVLANTKKGQKQIDKCRDSLYLYPSTFEKVSEENQQLKSPSKKGKQRSKILTLYREKGYGAVEKNFNRLRIMKGGIDKVVPSKIKSKIKKELKR